MHLHLHLSKTLKHSLYFSLGILAFTTLTDVTRSALAEEFDSHQPIAMVYDGPGACEDGCTKAAAQVARMAGYQVRLVRPNDITDQSTPDEITDFLKNTKVWLQPGGISNEAYRSMSEKLKEGVRNFIGGGGGYVGFCAGAFMATKIIGGTGEVGLGIFPGGTDLFENDPIPGVTFSLPEVTWMGSKRKIYFEGGPFIYGVDRNPRVEVIARYDDRTIAAARTHFGLGRVFITGLHPEAPRNWTEEDGVMDPDGPEQELAAQMVCWAGRKTKCSIAMPKNEPVIPLPHTFGTAKKWLGDKVDQIKDLLH